MSDLVVNIAGADEFPSTVKALVVGQPGVGLADFATSFPNPIWANMGSNLTTLARLGSVPYVNVSGEKDLFALKVALDRPEAERTALFGRPIETLVIDSVDELQSLMMANRLVKEGRTETKVDDWGWIAKRLNSIFKGITNLDINIVILCHTKEVNLGPETVAVKPGLGGAFCEGIHEYVDFSLYMRAYTDVLDTHIEMTLEEAATEMSPAQRLELQDAMYNVSVHPTVEDTDEITVTVPLDDEEVHRYVFASPQFEAEWVHDKTGTLPYRFPVDKDTYSVFVESMGEVNLNESSSIEIDLTTPSPEPEPTPTEPTVTEVQQNVEAPGVEVDPTDTSSTTDDEQVYICTDCNSHFGEKTWSDLSNMRFNTTLCGSCYKSK